MTGFDFVKSSHSSGSDECVEVAHNIASTVAVRDSKAPDGPILRLTPKAWQDFTTSLR
ncbi:DUF397 domain-containing protein [Streptomyces sp. NR30]|uniref:DUF397 domain-containing protein n=1 Tax=Streptomyces guryensis TaxID=2886947 RepID=A0A9Q3Z7H4_9ACTN|nr:DUF397 domain-containing protein [Streptomyces guryensis]MCD9872295.1 DUF397 domain-containing protein [Streptomyces guryensis]